MNTATWHEGERALQSRAGIGERMAEIGPRVVRDHMPDQHRGFFAQLPFLIAGSLDAERRPWASVLAASRIRPTRRTCASTRCRSRAIRCATRSHPARRSGCWASSLTRAGAIA
jgi:hypothetical protein